MNLTKVLVLCGVCSALSYAGISIHIDGGKKKKDKGWEVIERSCDGPTCCDLHIDGVSSEYDLRCNDRIEKATVKLYTNGDRASDHINEGHGRLHYTIDRGSRVELSIRGVPRIFKERMCDSGICCEFEQELSSREYKLRCDRPYDRAELMVKAGGRKERYTLDSRGRLPIGLRPGDRCELRMTPPPPPPPPEKKKKKEKGLDIHIRL